MNWEAIGAVGELVGAFAVVVTLAYLALQIRYTHRVAADTNHRFRAAGVMDGMKLVMTDQNLRRVVNSTLAMEEPYSDLGQKLRLSADDASTFDAFFVYCIWMHWGQYYSVSTGRDREEIKREIKNFYSMDAIRVCLQNSPYLETLDKEFIKLLEELVGEQD